MSSGMDAGRYKDVSGSWGDSSPTIRVDGPENASNFSADGSVPNTSSMMENKFPINTSLGASAERYPDTPNDNAQDFAADSAGFGDRGPNTQTDMDMNLAPNMFPRETGTDSLTTEESLLT